VNEYGTSDGYGGLAGFGGPALQAADAPVVRYQDLHRSHAPASAGAPSVGFGDVAMSPPDGMYGDVALVEGAQQAAPTYGGMGAMRPLYGGEYGAAGNDDFPLMIGSKGSKVKRLGNALSDIAAKSTDVFAVEAVRDNKEFTNYTAMSVWSFLNKKNPTTEPAGTFSGVTVDSTLYDRILKAAEETKASSSSDDDDSFVERTLRALSSGVQEAGKGVARGAARHVGVSRFEESGMDTKPVSKDTDKKEERPEWQTYAIWGGAAVAGVSLAYLLYRAYSKSEKKGA